MNGHLNEQPLVELIRDIVAQRGDGVLRLRHGSVKVVVYFEAGEIIYAAANLRELRLAEYVRKQELLSEEQLQSLEGNKADLTLAAILSQNGFIDQKSVIRLSYRSPTKSLMCSGWPCSWTEGSWEFDARTRLADPLRVKIDVPGLLLQATRKLPTQTIDARLPNRDEVFSPVSDLPDSTALLPTEGYLSLSTGNTAQSPRMDLA